MTMRQTFRTPFEEMKTDVFRQVAILAAYHAAKNDHQEEWCDRVPLIEEDQSMLDLFWQNSINRLNQVMAVDHDLHNHHATVHVSIAILQALARMFLINDILAQWFSITLPEAENKYKSAADAALMQCRRLLQLSHARKRMEP